jgi:tetratricopeptide (TPR) repeat protein
VSPLLKRLQAQLAEEPDPYRRAEFCATRACYLARIGNFQDARFEIAEIRTTFGDGRSGRVTVLLMLAEALVQHFGDLSANAADRVARALLLSKAMRDRQLIALTSSWMGYFQFEKSDYELSLRSIAEAMENADSQDHAALSRCAIVLLNTFALCGDWVSSQHWFLVGREHAVAEGDQAGIEALLHSKAVFGVAWLRVERCKREVDGSALTRSRQEIASARNLQHLTRIGALEDYIELADAMLSSIEGRYEAALAKLEDLEAKGPFPVGHFNQSVRAIERAFCCAGLGQTNSAVAALQEVDWAEVSSLDIDDRIVAAWMMSEMATKDSRLGDKASTLKQLKIAHDNHDEFVVTLSRFLLKFKSA